MRYRRTLECAGNGRAFFDPPVAGVQWTKGAVGTARWTGVRMADVLKRAGVSRHGPVRRHDGADRALGTMPAFVRQVPLDKAIHPDTIIAYEMNGSPFHRCMAYRSGLSCRDGRAPIR